MSTPRLRALLLALLLTAPLALRADPPPPSDPVGLFRQTLRGNSDTFVSLPLHRPPLVEAAIASLSGNQLTLAADGPALPAGGAYVLVMSGTLEGAILPVQSIAARAITVDPGAENLATLKTETTHGANQGDIVAIIPYWTLDTLFPNGEGINPSTNPLSRKTEILFISHTAPGINQAAAAMYYYYQGSAQLGSGWYKVGVSSEFAGATAFPPYQHFIVRHNIATSTELFLPGCVQLAAYRVPLLTRAANTDQDNFVALPIAVPSSFQLSGLVQSGAFIPSTNPLSRQDQLLRFSNTAIGKNKATVAIYYYYQGTAQMGPGWYLVGDSRRLADDDLLAAGESFVIRKKRTSAPATLFWSGLPSYLQ